MLDVDYLMCITKMNMISQLRQRVRQNGQATITAAEYDQLQREWITRTGVGLGDCHAELLEIHNILMCIAECPPIKDTDTYTVRGVKEMAYRLNGGNQMEGYYRSKTVNPNWYGIWTDQAKEGIPYEKILDNIAQMACGIDQSGASDQCQKYAEHIRAHIEAAFKVGQASQTIIDA